MAMGARQGRCVHGALIRAPKLQRHGAGEVGQGRLWRDHGVRTLGGGELGLGRELSVDERMLGLLVRVVVRRSVDGPIGEGPQRLLEGEALVVSLTLPLGLDAVPAGGLALIALDTTLATGCETPSADRAESWTSKPPRPRGLGYFWEKTQLTQTARLCPFSHGRLFGRRVPLAAAGRRGRGAFGPVEIEAILMRLHLHDWHRLAARRAGEETEDGGWGLGVETWG